MTSITVGTCACSRPPRVGRIRYRIGEHLAVALQREPRVAVHPFGSDIGQEVVQRLHPAFDQEQRISSTRLEARNDRLLKPGAALPGTASPLAMQAVEIRVGLEQFGNRRLGERAGS